MDDDLSRQLAAAPPHPGEVIALAGASGPLWLQAYQLLRASGAAPLLLDAAAPAAEVQRWLTQAGGTRSLRLDRSGPALVGRPSVGSHKPGTVLIPSSGTTGAARLSTRSASSLDREGVRHQLWSGLRTEDRVAMPLPLWHAYALGWVHACLGAGATLDTMSATSFGSCVDSINEGATVLPLVPAVARLLIARRGRGLRRPTALRLAMVGAGPVDAEMAERFRADFGVGLARNYGSSETGALFSAGPDVGPGCVGEPLDGVEFVVLDENQQHVAVGEAGELVVRLDGGAWHRTGDRAAGRADGLHILGRQTRAIRRGDRWVAPEEVESVLRGHPDVVDALVHAAPARNGRAGPIRADVVSLRGTDGDADRVLDHARRELAPHKVPDRVRLVGELARTSAGKVVLPQRLGLGDPAELVASAQAYKRSELLFALMTLGVMDELAARPAGAADLAVTLGIDEVVCAGLLGAAQACGLLRPVAADEPSDLEVAPILRWEHRLSRGWMTREAIADLARTGLAGRGFDQQPPEADMVAAYDEMMHTAAAQSRSALALSMVRFRPGQRLLEITCGPGRYARLAGAGSHVCAVGQLAGTDRCVLPEGPFDHVVVCNAVHLSGPGSDLRLLAGLLGPLGGLLVDDVFLDDTDGLSYQLDWLTHGGRAWPTEASLVAGLAKVGLTVRRRVALGTPASNLLLAERVS